MKCRALILLLLVFSGLGGAAFIYSGIYPIGADVPHTRLTFWVLETLRERSIDRASQDIEVPNLEDPSMLLSGGADYNEMCVTCHLKPGKEKSDMSQGLYPAPPNLSEAEEEEDDEDPLQEARHRFWVIKHGIKASGMPAWGKTHDDRRIWAMVAFLQKLPHLTPEQYQILTARKPGSGMSHH